MSDYEAALEKQIDEQQRKIAIYERIVETLLPLVCHCNSQFESDGAWLSAILPKLVNVMGESDISHHEKVAFNAKMRASDCENAFICCSRMNDSIQHGEHVVTKIYHKEHGKLGIFIDRSDPRVGY